MKQRVAIQADLLETLSFETDTSLRIAYAAQKRGYQVFFYTPQDLSLRSSSKMSPSVQARGRWLKFQGSFFEKSYTVSEEEALHLSEASVVLIRQNPPVDMAYLTTTYLLEYLPPSVFVINCPKAIRDCPEKIFPLSFPNLFPPTLISRDILEIKDFLKTHQKIIVKPLYKYGGQGISLLEEGKDINSFLRSLFEKEQEPFMFQKYLPEINIGDKRLLLVGGEAIGMHLRVPPKGSYLANTFQGGKVEKASYTERDLEIIETLKGPLCEKGLFFVGVDIIGNFVTEINTTSPTGFSYYNQLENTCLEDIFWDKVESLIFSA
ncbi:MAG: glutathione synthase [Proteobacteria bacterium]|nr:glutathione synthase [Pseudomonadota bacterium]